MYRDIILGLLADSLNNTSYFSRKYLPAKRSVWQSVLQTVCIHGIAGIIVSVLERLPKELLPPHDILMELIGLKVCCQTQYSLQFKTAERFAKELEKHQIECWILKGISFSIYYPDPTLRVCGDCDCYLVGKDGLSAFEKGNIIAKQIGAEVSFGTYKHSHIVLDGLLIENHKYLTDFNGTKRGVKIEKLLEKTIKNSTVDIIGNSNLRSPNVYFNALFMVRHALGNFISEGLSLRMLYDWATLINNEQNNIDWIALYKDLELCKIQEFANILTSICVLKLGLIIVCSDIKLSNNKQIVNDIINDTFAHNAVITNEEKHFHKVVRVVQRFHRMWKYRALAIESYPMMLWNSFAFCSYLKRKIILK